MQKPRLIIDVPMDGFQNMAADEALFDSAGVDGSTATLRLYRWAHPTITVGRRQKPEKVNTDLLRDRDIKIVRRTGGGGAVYHAEEITYCYVQRIGWKKIPDADRWRGIFSGFLEALGLKPDSLISSDDTKRQAGDICFSCAAGDEPLIGGKKWVGSSRRKSKVSFLQHGSILLKRQPRFIAELFNGADPDISIGLKEIVPSLTMEDAETELVKSISNGLSIDFAVNGYTRNEKEFIEKSATEKRREWKRVSTIPLCGKLF